MVCGVDLDKVAPEFRFDPLEVEGYGALRTVYMPSAVPVRAAPLHVQHARHGGRPQRQGLRGTTGCRLALRSSHVPRITTRSEASNIDFLARNTLIKFCNGETLTLKTPQY